MNPVWIPVVIHRKYFEFLTASLDEKLACYQMALKPVKLLVLYTIDNKFS